MLQMSNTKYSSTKSLISKRISDDNQNDLEELYRYEVCPDIEGIIVTFNIDRAVIENTIFFNEIMKTILPMDYKHYILDFSSTLFMDSTFLGALVVTLKKLKAKGSTLSTILDYDKIKILAPFEKLKNILNAHTSFEEIKKNLLQP